MENNFSGVLQENLLTLLCFDPSSASIIKNTVEVGMYSSSIFREIAFEAADFFETFNTPIGEHLPDVFEEVLNGSDQRQASMYRQVFKNLYSTKDSINKEYILSSLSVFLKERRLTKGIAEAAKFLKDGNVEEAESIILSATKSGKLHSFDHGMFLSESPSKVLNHLRTSSPFIPMGIPYFDSISLGPAPKEIITILAPPSRGKTWFMVHIGKQCLLRRKNVLHISLEMSEEKIMTRYYQSLFSISRRKARNKVAILKRNKSNNFDGIEFTKITRPTFRNKGLASFIQGRMPSVLNRYRLLVKQFPTGSLTIKQLETYLDNIEREYKFIPDVLIVDYADLMHLDYKNIRVETGQVFRNLRGLMIERNLAGVTASQSNRESSESKWVTMKHMAEDYSKAATSDMVVSICQTPLERSLGLCRLFVAKNRDEEDSGTVLTTQGIPFGQFISDSVHITGADGEEYWKEIEKRPSLRRED